MDDKDKEALELAFEMASRDPEYAEHMQAKLAGKPDPSGGWFLPPQSWEEVAQSAVYSTQMDNLRLKPWECPPCQVGDRGADLDRRDLHRYAAAAALKKRMLDAGISHLHPDPLAALEEAKHQ